jgi:hypothetical protein
VDRTCAVPGTMQSKRSGSRGHSGALCAARYPGDAQSTRRFGAESPSDKQTQSETMNATWLPVEPLEFQARPSESGPAFSYRQSRASHRPVSTLVRRLRAAFPTLAYRRSRMTYAPKPNAYSRPVADIRPYTTAATASKVLRPFNRPHRLAGGRPELTFKYRR